MTDRGAAGHCRSPNNNPLIPERYSHSRVKSAYKRAPPWTRRGGEAIGGVRLRCASLHRLRSSRRCATCPRPLSRWTPLWASHRWWWRLSIPGQSRAGPSRATRVRTHWHGYQPALRSAGALWLNIPHWKPGVWPSFHRCIVTQEGGAMATTLFQRGVCELQRVGGETNKEREEERRREGVVVGAFLVNPGLELNTDVYIASSGSRFTALWGLLCVHVCVCVCVCVSGGGGQSMCRWMKGVKREKKRGVKKRKTQSSCRRGSQAGAKGGWGKLCVCVYVCV